MKKFYWLSFLFLSVIAVISLTQIGTEEVEKGSESTVETPPYEMPDKSSKKEYVVYLHIEEGEFDKEQHPKNVKETINNFISIEGSDNIKDSLENFPILLMTLNDKEYREISKSKLVKTIKENAPLNFEPDTQTTPKSDLSVEGTER